VNELVNPRAQPADESRTARQTPRVLVVEAIGPLTVLGGIVWAFAQPYRVTFFYSAGKGFWDWAVQPPLLVVLVGLLFSLLVAPGLVEDLERSESPVPQEPVGVRFPETSGAEDAAAG
jgi:hypothetical protein